MLKCWWWATFIGDKHTPSIDRISITWDNKYVSRLFVISKHPDKSSSTNSWNGQYTIRTIMFHCTKYMDCSIRFIISITKGRWTSRRSGSVKWYWRNSYALYNIYQLTESKNFTRGIYLSVVKQCIQNIQQSPSLPQQ